MRDYLLIYINGKEHRVRGEDTFLPLSTYLRYSIFQTGTKVVCEEGDCGACSIILGQWRDDSSEISYRAVNSCIQFLYQLDCTHVITVEGLKYDGKLNPIQESMVECHGAQCGYCTPGFITTMCSMFENAPPRCDQDVKNGLTGNLCRCTGYEPIIKAALAVDNKQVMSLARLYPPDAMKKAFAEHKRQAVKIETAAHTFFKPVDLAAACKFKQEAKGCTIVAGGTDVCVYWNKRHIEPAALISLAAVPGLHALSVVQSSKGGNGKASNADASTQRILTVGASTTLAQLEDYIGEFCPEFKRILWLFGSPQIRHAGTLAGNIGNGSPIADSLPFLFVTDSEVEVTGTSGSRRIKMTDLYADYKKLTLKPDEIITAIHIPLPAPDKVLKLYKVSRRKHLDISAVTAAFLLTFKGDTIAEARVSYGGIDKVVKRATELEKFLTGKKYCLETFEQAGELIASSIKPLSDVRGSADFRKQLCVNILLKLYFELANREELACR